MKSVSGEWITNPDTQQVMSLITDAGYCAYFVGGCVRNALLGVAVNDIDISTDAVPDTVMQLAKDAGLKVIPTGIDHGTVSIISNGIAHEITTFRCDVETDGRHAVVAFSSDINDDAVRRDFTMNALYADALGNITDPLNGMPDLLARRVRFIQDADQRIKEDYLRILRFFRFHAWYGDASAGLDTDGLAACAENLDGLKAVSKERIGAEVMKLLAAANPSQSMAAMSASGVLNTILAGADVRHLPILVHLEQELGMMPDALRRLACVTQDAAKEPLRLSNKQGQQQLIFQQEIGRMRGAAELGYRFGELLAQDIILLRSALFETAVDQSDLSKIKLGAGAKFPVRPADLMPKYTGAALGKQLNDLESRWVRSQFMLSKKQLLA